MNEITNHGGMEGQTGIWKLKTSCVTALSAVTHWGAFMGPKVHFPLFSGQLNKGRWQAPMILPYLGDEHIHQVSTTKECLMGYMRPHTQMRRDRQSLVSPNSF